MSTPSGDAECLASELASLQARQEALLPQLRHRNHSDQQLIEGVQATFAQIPEYIAKLRRAQKTMDALAVRTKSMRKRSEELVKE